MTTGSTVIDVNNLCYNDPKEVMLKNYVDKTNAQLDNASKCISCFMLICLIGICCVSVYIFMKYT